MIISKFSKLLSNTRSKSSLNKCDYFIIIITSIIRKYLIFIVKMIFLVIIVSTFNSILKEIPCQ